MFKLYKTKYTIYVTNFNNSSSPILTLRKIKNIQKVTLFFFIFQYSPGIVN